MKLARASSAIQRGSLISPREGRSEAGWTRRAVETAPVVSKLLVAGLVVTAHLGFLPVDRMSILLKLLGLGSVCSLAFMLSRGVKVPIEVKLYAAFVLWGLACAPFVAADSDAAFRHGWTLVQLSVLLLVTAYAHIRQPDLKILMSSFWLLGVTFAAVVMLDPSVIAQLDVKGGRLRVFEINPNTVGQVWVLSSLSSLYLLEQTKAGVLRLLLQAAVPVFALLLLSTGSRKMFVALVLMHLAWMVLSQNRERKRAFAAKSTKWVWMLIPLIASGVMLRQAWPDSIMEKRWDQTMNQVGLERLDGREQLIELGWQMFLSAPLAGVGLANQSLEARLDGSPVHNDYIDVLATTGITGAALYFSIYWIAGARAKRAGREARKRLANLPVDLRLFWTYLLVYLWLMFGFARYHDITNIVLLGALVGRLASAELYASGRALPRAHVRTVPSSGSETAQREERTGALRPREGGAIEMAWK